MEILEDKITLLYSVLYISRYKEYCYVLWNNIHLYIYYIYIYIHCNKTKIFHPLLLIRVNIENSFVLCSVPQSANILSFLFNYP